MIEAVPTEQTESSESLERKLSQRLQSVKKTIETVFTGVVTSIMVVGIIVTTAESYVRHVERNSVVAEAGADGGKLYDRFGFHYKDSLDFRVERLNLPKSDDHMVLESFDTDYGELSAEDIITVAETSYPKNWFEDNVSEIRYVDSDLDTDRVQGHSSGKGVAVASSTPSHGRKSIITFYKPARELGPVYHLKLILPHESCHAFEQNLAVELDTHLMSAIADRIESPDRFHSEYVESFDTNSDSLSPETKKGQRFVKAREYWAEICGQFLRDPMELNIKDYNIVSEQISRVDPAFNWQMANKNSEEIYKKLTNEYIAKIEQQKNAKDSSQNQ